MKYILFLVLVTAFMVVPTVSAQQCSYPEDGYVGYAPAVTPCSSILPKTTAIQWTNAYDLDCVDTNTMSVYWTYKTSNVTGYGQNYCDALGSIPCKPIMALVVTTATSPSDYNRFYNQAYDTMYVGVQSLTGCAKTTNGFRQDFRQCQGVACAGCV